MASNQSVHKNNATQKAGNHQRQKTKSSSKRSNETKKTASTKPVRRKKTAVKSAADKETANKVIFLNAREDMQKKPAIEKVYSKEELELIKEIKIWIMLGAMLLLILCVFHVCPGVGEWIYNWFHGLFGTMAYFLPFCFIGTYLFYLANEGSAKAIEKLRYVWALVLVLCGMIQLLSFASDTMLGIDEYYSLGQNSFSGGVVGGIICGILQNLIGFLGTLLVFVIACIVIGIKITEQSFMRPIKQQADALRDNAKVVKVEKVATEEREKKNREKPNKKLKRKIPFMGHIADAKDLESVDIPEQEQEILTKDNPEVKDKGNELDLQTEAVKTDVFTGSIQRPQPQENDLQNKTEIYAKKDTRTLEELDALEPIEHEQEETVQVIKDLEISPVVSDLPEENFTKGIPTDKEKSIVIDAKEVQEELPPSSLLQEKTEKIFMSADNTSIWKEEKKVPNRNATSGTMFQTKKPETKKKRKPHVFPSLELLNTVKPMNSVSDETLKATAVKLQQTLHDFGVGVTVTNISCGPTVTRYELHPDQGVKVSRIIALTDDIKLNLAAADIRIEAPIPGKSAIGIEVPNEENQLVPFRELVSCGAFKKHPSKLAFAVGKDISGQIIVTDLAKTPHLLIAGATGSGKSVCINTLIMSILYKSKPDEVKFLMIDPKVVELSIYNGIPHLLIPVVTDARKAANALNWAVAEMDDRYKKMSEYGVRDLKGYNKKIEEENKYLSEGEKKEKLCQMVIIVDELADLMMVAQAEVETAICRLAQKARAAEMHLVLATQRPSVNVITGVIKANVPSRIAFAVSSGVDSRTILDMNGAEKLLGKGDMLFYPSGIPKPVRVQGAFVSDEEVATVVDFFSKQYSYGSQFQLDLEQDVVQTSVGAQAINRDEYFIQAARFVIEKEKATIGMMQRAFKIGFNRAARIMDQLASEGIVGAEEGTKPRKVLMTMAEFEEYLEKMS